MRPTRPPHRPASLRPSRRALLAGLAAAPLAGLFGPGGPGAARAAAKLSVVATTSMIGDLARAVGGDRVEAQALMGPGVDPHSYRQTRSDIVKLARADLAPWSGLYLEAQMEDFLRDLGRRRPAPALAETLPEDRLLTHPEYTGRYDPHVWMDPGLWRELAAPMRDALTGVDPEGAATYAANAETCAEELRGLDAYAREILSTVPEDRRVLVTAHDAFRYFGRAYGFEVLGIQGISTESEAGLARVQELVDTLVARKIPAVFVESSVPERNVRSLIEGARARGHEVRVGAELFSDAMGQPGTYEGTYVGMIDHNVTAIARAQGGTAPERGLNGRLSAGL
ncbi:MAG: zinc ABC transporter substrate-binding protein [Pseudomonadota bacterium]|nr:zinc ABC transporter substrate-binding protein [Pseudomonadota bacterium]